MISLRTLFMGDAGDNTPIIDWGMIDQLHADVQVGQETPAGCFADSRLWEVSILL